MNSLRSAHRLTPALAATGVAAAVLTAAATPALAAGTAPASSRAATQAACLAGVQQHAKDLVAQRQATLTSLAGKVTAAPRLTPTDKADVTAVISSTRSGLTALAATIAADTTCPQARTDTAKIFTDYRVYAIVVPQAHLLLAADHGLAALTHLQTAEGKLQTAITAADAEGRDTIPAQAALKDLQTRIADATTQLTTAHTDAAALTPAAFNADHDVTAPARQAARTAHQDITAAVADVRAAVADLGK